MIELAFEISAPELVRTKPRGQRRSLRAAAAADMADQAVAIKDGVDGAAGGDPEITGKTADQQLADARVRPEHKPCGHPSAACPSCSERSKPRSATVAGWRSGPASASDR